MKKTAGVTHEESLRLRRRVGKLEAFKRLPSGGGDASTLQGHPAADFSLTTHDHDAVYNALSDGVASISWATGWSSATGCSLRKASNGLVVLNLNATYAGGGAAAICTLPAGFRPPATVYSAAQNAATPAAFAGISVASSGAVTLTNTLANGTFRASLVFPST